MTDDSTYIQAKTVYEMSFSKRVWKMWREAPGFWQRYERAVSKNGKIITGLWKKSADGSKWEHDFDVTYTRLNQDWPQGGNL